MVTDLQSSGLSGPYNLTHNIRSRLRGLGRIKETPGKIQEISLNKLARYFPDEVVAIIIFKIIPPDNVLYAISDRSEKEGVLAGKKTVLMETMELKWQLLNAIKKRVGRGQPLTTFCYKNFFPHEVGYGVENFEKKAPRIFKPRAAGAIEYKQLERKYTKKGEPETVIKDKKIKVIVFEQVEEHTYTWDPNETSTIELITEKELRENLYLRVDDLIPAEPGGYRKNCKWLIDRVVDDNSAINGKFDLGTLTIPVRSKVKRGYVMPISRTPDHLYNSLRRILHRN